MPRSASPSRSCCPRAPLGASYCTVRFGNVLGSRGSVIPTFTRQIANGGPVTVTDARMTRFFMSVEEAVQLVLESSVLSDGGGEVFMLEMGEPVRILDLAERMIRLSGYQVGVDIPIEIVGMPTGGEARRGAPDTRGRGPDHLPSLHQPADPDHGAGRGVRRSVWRSCERPTARRDADAVRKLLFSVGTLAASAVSPTRASPPATAPDRRPTAGWPIRTGQEPGRIDAGPDRPGVGRPSRSRHDPLPGAHG